VSAVRYASEVREDRSDRSAHLWMAASFALPSALLVLDGLGVRLSRQDRVTVSRTNGFHGRLLGALESGSDEGVLLKVGDLWVSGYVDGRLWQALWQVA